MGEAKVTSSKHGIGDFIPGPSKSLTIHASLADGGSEGRGQCPSRWKPPFEGAVDGLCQIEPRLDQGVGGIDFEVGWIELWPVPDALAEHTSPVLDEVVRDPCDAFDGSELCLAYVVGSAELTFE